MKKFITFASMFLSVAARADFARVAIKPTTDASKVTGWATLEDTKEGLKVTAQLSGLTPGQHGFHIHEWGDCSDSGKAAGAHYNPKNAAHGDALAHGPKKAHAGDLGNVTADEKGAATVQVTLKGVKISDSKFHVAGRAVIVHEKADDFSQPAGNAGGRVACGVIAQAAPEKK